MLVTQDMDFSYRSISIAVLLRSIIHYYVRHMAHRSVPLNRHEVDKQLTMRILIQVVVGIFILLSYTIVSVLLTSNNLFKKKSSLLQLPLLCFTMLNFAVSIIIKLI